MATGLINPLGAVALWDGENPRTFTAGAKEAISGGDFVYCSGVVATGVVGSQASSYVTEDLSAALCAVYGQVNGIALNNAGSGELVTIATRGTYLLKAAAPVSGGMLVQLEESNFDGVTTCGPGDGATNGSWAGIIGRSLSAAGSDYYCLVSLNL